MEKIKPYNYKFIFDSINNDTNPQNNNINYIQEDDFIFLINSLSSLIKEYFLSISNIIKTLKTNSLELNKYILTSKCLINEMNSKINIQERIKQFNKNIEGINISNKYINNNIISLEMNLNKLFNNSKTIFKKMKDYKKNKFRTLSDINNYANNINSNRNQIILEQKNINQYNNRIKCLKLSLDTNKLNSFCNTNKSNINNTSSRKNWNTKREKYKNTINISQKNIKNKNSDLTIDDIDFLGKKIHKSKEIIKESYNRYRKKRNNSQHNITTNLALNDNISEIKNLLDNSPERKRISISTQKITPLCTNFNNYNYYYSYKNKCSSSGSNTARRNEEYNYFNKYNKLRNFNSSEKSRINLNTSFSENININNILRLFENLTEYFYLLSQYQNNIININQNNKDSNNLYLKLKKSLIELNKSIFLNNDLFIINNIIKQKLFSLIRQNDNINQRLKLLISRINYNKNNNISNVNNNIELKNNLISDYIKIIEKLKVDNNNLSTINQKIINQNKILIQKLNLKEKNQMNKSIDSQNNNNTKIIILNQKQNKTNINVNKLLKENKEYLFQIKNLKDDNEELLKLIKNKNLDNKEIFTNRNNKENSPDKKNNNILTKKDNEIKKLKELLEENKINNDKLKEINKEKDNKIKKLNELLSSLKNKSDTNYILINEKNSIISELNSKIKQLNKEINNISDKAKQIKDINIFKEQIEKQEKEINELKQIVNNKNNDIKNINNNKIKIENELNKMKNEIENKNKEIQTLNSKYKELTIEKNSMDAKNKINTEKEIKNLKEKIAVLQKENTNIIEEKGNCLKIIDEKSQEINQLDSIINMLKEKMKDFEKNNNVEEEGKIDVQDIENDIINYKDTEENEILKNNLDENKQFSIEMGYNNENQSKRLSTPSFKSPEKDDDIDNKNDKSNNIIELKKINDLLLKKIVEYESMLKINLNAEEIENDYLKNNAISENNINNNDGKDNDIKYYQDKYIQSLKVIHEYKKKCEFYEISNENVKNDLVKSKSEIKELTKKLKENNITFDNNNNFVTSISSIKLNNLYNPNEYNILCDKEYNKFKWFLMKKKSKEDEEEEEKTYDNLIWVPKIDVVDLNKFNQYINQEEIDNTNEIINLVKKLEEKENTISKLTYRLEILEKEMESNITYSSYEQNFKNKSIYKNNNFYKNSLNEDSSIINDNGYVISIRKDSTRSQKNMESYIPIEKYNILLEKLSQTEENYGKLQKENVELRKYYKLYLQQNDNNPININQENENELINSNKKDKNNKINIINNNEEEDNYYKNKYDELEMKLKIMKEACKNIKLLIRLIIFIKTA